MVLGVDLFFSLFNNLTIFIALVAIYSYLYSLLKERKWYIRQLILGLSFGLFAIGCMYAKIPVFKGVIVDQRNAIIALCGAFGGPLSAFISAFIAGAYRVFLGGDGVVAGIIGVHLAAFSGIILNRIGKSFQNFQKAAIGSLISVVIILPGFLFVGDLPTGWALLKQMALPYGLAIYIGIFIVGLLLQREENRFHAELVHRESEEKYRVLFESFPLGIIISNKRGKIIETNKIAEEILDIPEKGREELTIGSHLWNIIRADGSEMPPEEYAGVNALKDNLKVNNLEMGVKKKSGKIIWLNVTAAPIPLDNYGSAIIYNDISIRKEAESQLKKALSEKTVLLQELYHRTKNNMQVIIALMESQSEYIKSNQCLDILKETQNRIHSMALVHQKLYQSQDLSHINLNSYIRELVEWLVHSYQVTENKVVVEYQMEDVLLLIDTAIPCGLIIQELISNIFKHAFPGKRSGKIFIELKKISSNEIFLRISDNGVGVDSNFSFPEDGRLGLNTVFALGEVQLQGKIVVNAENGLAVSLTFKDNHYLQRV